MATSTDGVNWQQIFFNSQIELYSVSWCPELKIFIAGGSNIILRSTNATTWINDGKYINYEVNRIDARYRYLSWSPQLGIFVFADSGGGVNTLIHTSSDGITWTRRDVPTITSYSQATSIAWSPQLGIFFVTSSGSSVFQLISTDGINWKLINVSVMAQYNILLDCNTWSPELGIFCGGTGEFILISSLKGRPPTSYNVFDSSFNRIDENGRWDFLNINVTTLSVTGTFTNTSDDRLKHNEVAITNGLNIIDRLTPKFYQKTQDLLDANYNGDLSNHAWTYEAGLIAQEVLQISDLSFVVGGGDYYEQKYNLITQTQDVSSNYYDSSANNYELSNNYYDQSANNYEVSYNLITQAYNLNYNSVFVYGLAAIKELHTKVKANEISILNRQAIINNLITRIEALESVTQDVSNNIL